ncbi:SUF system Fe-S cluster assembly protein [Maricaulis sp.]|uniref:SUF system Fe-S cluster assembly protein n=1 Tax=Maricaulis sp. TaxID=1486257 RepID=UPI0026356D9F|nr:SUF system Fe-S cluster assembly protein [Maricaulis sp.]
MTDNSERDVIDLSGSKMPAPAEPVTEAPEAGETAPVSAIPEAELARITDDIVTQLKTVFDPEIPVDIYELGLIYKVDLEDDRSLKVEMTLTAPGCPVAGEMPVWVKDAVEQVDGVEKAVVELTFEPPWTPERMSDEARLALNMF